MDRFTRSRENLSTEGPELCTGVVLGGADRSQGDKLHLTCEHIWAPFLY